MSHPLARLGTVIVWLLVGSAAVLFYAAVIRGTL
jgi:hypothetical protein